MIYYRRYSGDYLRDTARLNLTEHGAYSLLMDYYYVDERPLPLDRGELYLMLRAMRPEDRKAVDRVLSMYFTEEHDGWHQKRIDHEILVSQTARANGKHGGRPITGIETGSITGDGTEHETDDETGMVPGSGHPSTTSLQPSAFQPSTANEPDLASQGGASPPASTPGCPHVEIVDAYHRHLPMGRQVNLKVWNGTRKKHLQARWREDKERQSVDWWENFFTYCAKSAFLTGKVLPRQGRDPFQVSLDWIVNPSNFAKIIEGAYER